MPAPSRDRKPHRREAKAPHLKPQLEFCSGILFKLWRGRRAESTYEFNGRRERLFPSICKNRGRASVGTDASRKSMCPGHAPTPGVDSLPPSATMIGRRRGRAPAPILAESHAGTPIAHQAVFVVVVGRFRLVAAARVRDPATGLGTARSAIVLESPLAAFEVGLIGRKGMSGLRE
jgi:hypothetical protein